MKSLFLMFILVLITVNVVFGNSLNINLDKQVYVPSSKLSGSINLNLSSALDLGISPKITISLGNSREERDIISILKSLEPNLNIQESSINSVNPENEKIFDLDSPKLFILKTTKGSIIDRADFEIEGLSNNGFPFSPYLDVDNDDTIEWIFIGSFNSWSDNSVVPKGLTNKKSNEEIVINDNSFLYCNILDLPFSNLFNISINIIAENIEGNISLGIFDFNPNTETASNKRGTCTLPNNLGNNELSCVINTTIFLNGNHLVCFYNTENSGKYNLILDEIGNTSYRCSSSLLDTDEEKCSFLETGDLFIKSFKPNFLSELRAKVKLSSTVLDNFNEIITNNVENCKEDKNNECNIIIKAASKNNQGSIKLSNLNLEYTKPNSIVSTSRKFYNLEFIQAKILGLGNTSFKNYSLNIPISVFDNFTIPSAIGNSTNMSLIVKLNNLVAEKNIEINTNLVPSTKIIFENSKSILTKLKDNKDINEFLLDSGLDLSLSINILNNYESELDNIEKDSLLSIDAKSEKVERIKGELNLLIKDLPKSVIIKEDISYPRITPEKINEQILGNEKEENILALQDSVTIDTNVKLIRTTDFSDKFSEKTYIKRAITSELSDYFIFEDIPKEVAQTTDSITIGNKDSTIVKTDPLIKWHFTGKGELRYIINGNVLNKIDKIITVVFSQPKEEPKASVCGDNICTEILEDKVSCPVDCKPKYKINWFLIIFLIIILILGIIYFNFFMSKKRLTYVFRKKPLFTTPQDETNLKNYILKSLNKKVPKSLIYKILLKKKWTKDQIDYVFKKINK